MQVNLMSPHPNTIIWDTENVFSCRRGFRGGGIGGTCPPQRCEEVFFRLLILNHLNTLPQTSPQICLYIALRGHKIAFYPQTRIPNMLRSLDDYHRGCLYTTYDLMSPRRGFTINSIKYMSNFQFKSQENAPNHVLIFKKLLTPFPNQPSEQSSYFFKN